MEQQNRHLAAILFTDVVGYTAMMQQNEKLAVAAIKRHNSVLETLAAAHHGRVINYYGDGSLSIFQSATEAIQSAIEIQIEMQKDPAVPLRIGLHIGEIFFEDEKALGDGVNLASRIQSLGQANTILFSGEIHDKIKNNPEFKSVSLGFFDFKNVDKPIEVYALSNPGLNVPKKDQMEGKLKHGVNKLSPLKKTILAGAVIILALISFWMYNLFAGKKKFTGLDKSVVVIPFQNLTKDSSNAYLSDGIAEDITNQLLKIVSLKVISGPSALRYKNSKKTVKQIAEETGASSLLEGNVELVGDAFRITAKLIDAGTEEIIWSANYDTKNKNDLLTIQSEVALRIAEGLNAKLSSDEKNNIQKEPTSNPIAYNLCLRGRAFWNQRSVSGFRKAIVYFDSAIKLDPNYSIAYSGKADCLSAMGYSGVESPANTFLKAEACATRALELDPSLADAHASLGYINFYFTWDWTAAEQQFKRAIELDPKYAIAYDWYGIYLTARERFDEAQTQIGKAQQLNPLSTFIGSDMGWSLYYSKKYDSAIKAFNSTLELDPNFLLGHLWLGRTYEDKKMYKEALEQYQIVVRLNKNFIPGIAGIGHLYGVSGQKAEAEKILAQFKEMATRTYVSPYAVALVYLSMGDKDKTFECLDKALEDRTHWLVWLKLDPRWDPIHNDPRYFALKNKIGLPD